MQSGFSVPKSKPKPKSFVIEEIKGDNAPFTVMAADISQDGAYLAVVKGRQDISLINLGLQPIGSNFDEKDIKPRTIQIKLASPGSYIMDVFLYREPRSGETYLYVIASDAIYLSALKLKD